MFLIYRSQFSKYLTVRLIVSYKMFYIYKTCFIIFLVHNLLAKKMGVEKGYRIIPASREHLLPLLPQSREELEPRSMQDSFTSAIIPLSQDLDLQDKYISFLGYVRLGRLLEDMDIFAGNLCGFI